MKRLARYSGPICAGVVAVSCVAVVVLAVYSTPS